MNIVKLKKSGNFYILFDEDCYILYFLLGYKMKNGKSGFPKSALNKVINKLEENKISYEVMEEDLKNDFKKLNRYQKFVLLGKQKYNKEIYYQNILDKLYQASDCKLEKILSTIEMILDE